MKVTCSKFVFFLLILFSASANAGYDLKTQLRFYLPPSIQTVGAAVNYFITPHKYQVVKSDKVERILGRSLPRGLPYGSVLTVEQALLAVTETDEAVIIDRQNQLISFSPLINEIGIKEGAK